MLLGIIAGLLRGVRFGCGTLPCIHEGLRRSESSWRVRSNRNDMEVTGSGGDIAPVNRRRNRRRFRRGKLGFRKNADWRSYGKLGPEKTSRLFARLQDFHVKAKQ